MAQQVKVAKPGGKRQVGPISSQDKIIDRGDKKFQ